MPCLVRNVQSSQEAQAASYVRYFIPDFIPDFFSEFKPNPFSKVELNIIFIIPSTDCTYISNCGDVFFCCSIGVDSLIVVIRGTGERHVCGWLANDLDCNSWIRGSSVGAC